jgi:membrane-associated protease RseP (regulator of RpoE activity)
MLLGEPSPTQADLHFRLLGIPVRIHPFFWVTTVFLGMGSKEADPKEILVWVAVVLVSILVHEFGHATMQRWFGGHPRVTLYGLGGLASCDDCDRSPMRQIMILLAGPGAGFLFAGIIIVALVVTGHVDEFRLSWIPIRLQPFDPAYYVQNGRPAIVDLVILDLLYVNIAWGLVNLLPVYPLDGGQLSRELFTLRNPRAGIIQSLQLSAGVAVLVAIYAISKGSIYTCAMFGILAYNNFQTLQAYRNQWR